MSLLYCSHQVDVHTSWVDNLSGAPEERGLRRLTCYTAPTSRGTSVLRGWSGGFLSPRRVSGGSAPAVLLPPGEALPQLGPCRCCVWRVRAAALARGAVWTMQLNLSAGLGCTCKNMLPNMPTFLCAMFRVRSHPRLPSGHWHHPELSKTAAVARQWLQTGVGSLKSSSPMRGSHPQQSCRMAACQAESRSQAADSPSAGAQP